MGLRLEHRQHKALNNRAENSHQPTRRRDRIMKRFKSARQAQQFLSVRDQVANLFHIPYPESVTPDFLPASDERASGRREEKGPVAAANLCPWKLKLSFICITLTWEGDIHGRQRTHSNPNRPRRS
jgi:hypothetical protein